MPWGSLGRRAESGPGVIVEGRWAASVKAGVCWAHKLSSCRLEASGISVRRNRPPLPSSRF